VNAAGIGLFISVAELPCIAPSLPLKLFARSPITRISHCLPAVLDGKPDQNLFQKRMKFVIWAPTAVNCLTAQDIRRFPGRSNSAAFSYLPGVGIFELCPLRSWDRNGSDSNRSHRGCISLRPVGRCSLSLPMISRCYRGDIVERTCELRLNFKPVRTNAVPE
jgi:hypothetical protein